MPRVSGVSPYRRPGSPRTTARAIEAKEKADRAVVMKKAGYSFRQIAAHLNYKSPDGARKAVIRGMQDNTAKMAAGDLRLLDLERTEDWIHYLQKGLLAGNPRHIEVGVRVLERRAKMLGYDLEAQEQGQASTPLVINILADPRDSGAQQLVARRVDPNADLLARPEALPAPAGGTLLDGADNGAGGGNRRG